MRIGLTRLSEADRRRAEDAMVSRAAFLACLLADDMPDDIEEAFTACSAQLFPTSSDELDADCSCPDWASPCKHVAAVYYLLAEAFDQDPFLVLTWRGRPRDVLLANLRALRGSGPAEPSADASGRRRCGAWPRLTGRRGLRLRGGRPDLPRVRRDHGRTRTRLLATSPT